MQSHVYGFTRNKKREICELLANKLLCSETGFLAEEIVPIPCGHSEATTSWDRTDAREASCSRCGIRFPDAFDENQARANPRLRPRYIKQLLHEKFPDWAELHNVRNDGFFDDFCQQIADRTGQAEIPDITSPDEVRQHYQTIIEGAVEQASSAYRANLASYQGPSPSQFPTLHQVQSQQHGIFRRFFNYLDRVLNSES